MGELLFPLAAVGVVVFGAIPLLTLLARHLLARRRAQARAWVDFGSDSTLALLVAPTLLPLVWLLSSALHQIEPSRMGDGCRIDHAMTHACIDALLLVALLAGGLVRAFALRAWRERPGNIGAPLPPSHPLVARLRRIVAADPLLADLPITVAQRAPEPVFVTGLLRQTISLDACFVRAVDDDALRAALLHEREHLTARDTLRTFLARALLHATPAGALLLPDLERWRHAREAACDGDAVHRCASPLALADSLLHALRFRCGPACPEGATALCGHDASALRLRIQLLLHGPRRTPRITAPSRTLLALVVALVVLPHFDRADLLDDLHHGVEALLHSHDEPR